MARKLVTVQKIVELTPIPGADRIEVASILGWHCVVKKDDFKVDDWCVFYEIDSFLPVKDEYSFLEHYRKKLVDGSEGYRLKTIRLRGQISQGLAMPLSVIPAGLAFDKVEGYDLTSDLGVLKYERPIPANLRGLMKGSFPSFIPKTDETRVQVLQAVLTRYKGVKCYVSEKIDGTSVTYYLKEGEFGVCSRNIDLLETEDNVYWKIARQYDIEAKLKSVGGNIAIQGEIFGLGIQGNPLKQISLQVNFFNVFYIDDYKYLDYVPFVQFMADMALPIVPVLTTTFELIDDVPKLVELSKDKSIINKKFDREGIVIRPLVEQVDMAMASGFGNGRLSFKSINPEYLLIND